MIGAGLTALGVSLGAAQAIDTVVDTATGAAKDPIGTVYYLLGGGRKGGIL